MIFRAYLLGFIYVWERSYICEAIVAEQFFIAFPINNQVIFCWDIVLPFPRRCGLPVVRGVPHGEFSDRPSTLLPECLSQQMGRSYISVCSKGRTNICARPSRASHLFKGGIQASYFVIISLLLPYRFCRKCVQEGPQSRRAPWEYKQIKVSYFKILYSMDDQMFTDFQNCR